MLWIACGRQEEKRSDGLLSMDRMTSRTIVEAVERERRASEIMCGDVIE